MHGNKHYTNTTFTKRVDHDPGHDYMRDEAIKPAVCKVCGSIFHNRRWVLPSVLLEKNYALVHPMEVVTCPACHQENTGIPGGYIYLEGAFLAEHQKDIEHLLRNEA